tara:strand:- start:600 stop:1193 length:594 start_codon:yes stop_codon:yes gene_type:complete
MKGIYNFVITPIKGRYNNIVEVDDKELILNTQIFTHQFVNREALVLETPVINDTGIKKGDIVIVHHNVFRRYHDIKGKEKNSRSYYKDNKYFVYSDQIYLYKRNNIPYPLKGYTFVKPIESNDIFNLSNETELIGVVKHTDSDQVEINDLVGFLPNSEYEFVIDDERLYRVLTPAITIKYEYQGNEKEYNPSWTQSS